jgi:hypothetical protein
MRIGRRMVLRGVGATLALPWLESFAGLAGKVHAQVMPSSTQYAFFFRQASGVACAQNTGEIGQEPERFWPRTRGALDPANVQGRALDELTNYLDKLLVVGNVRYGDFDWGDGHAAGALMALTAARPVVNGAGGNAEAAGESIDHRIGRELNPNGRDSLFLYASSTGGWLGGPCVSYRGPGQRRAALHNPQDTWNAVVGSLGMAPGAAGAAAAAARRRSVKDVLRGQIQSLLSHPRLGTADKRRLDLHFSTISDIETQLNCQRDENIERSLDGVATIFRSSDGPNIWRAARLHMDVAALAIACGYTRSVTLQIGSGNDGASRYMNPATGQLMENYHYISHRRLSHDSRGTVIAGSDLLHHQVDRQFAQAFRHMLDRLSAYSMPDDKTLLDHGVAVWFNDNSNGPAHSRSNVPWILAGSANGFLRQGQYINIAGNAGNHAKLLNTIGSAAGIRKQNGGYLDDFGDQSLRNAGHTGVCTELLV